VTPPPYPSLVGHTEVLTYLVYRSETEVWWVLVNEETEEDEYTRMCDRVIDGGGIVTRVEANATVTSEILVAGDPEEGEQ